jgi:hypothetical protein
MGNEKQKPIGVTLMGPSLDSSVLTRNSNEHCYEECIQSGRMVQTNLSITPSCILIRASDAHLLSEDWRMGNEKQKPMGGRLMER